MKHLLFTSFFALLPVLSTAMTITDAKVVDWGMGGCDDVLLEKCMNKLADSTYVNDDGDTLKYGTPELAAYGFACSGSTYAYAVSWKLDDEDKYFANMWMTEGYLGELPNVAYVSSVHFQAVSDSCMGNRPFYTIQEPYNCHIDTSFTVRRSDWDNYNISKDSNIYTPIISSIVSSDFIEPELSSDYSNDYEFYSCYKYEPRHCDYCDKTYVYCLYQTTGYGRKLTYNCRVISFCGSERNDNIDDNYIYTYLEEHDEDPLIESDDPKLVKQYKWNKLKVNRYSDGTTKKFLEK